MKSTMFTCDVIFHGSRLVNGVQSPASLTTLVESVVKSADEDIGGSEQSRSSSDKWQLRCNEERFSVVANSVKKDEGFESDCESSTSSDDPLCPNTEIKVIQDHVLLLEKLIQEDSSSQGFSSASDCSLGSGTDSDEDLPKPPVESVNSETSVVDSNILDTTSRQGSSYSVDTQKNTAMIMPEHAQKENLDLSIEKHYPGEPPQLNSTQNEHFLVSDILFCHVSVLRPCLVVIVVKSITCNQVKGHVFECSSETDAKNLYSHYHSVSNKYKLDKYRNSKRKLEHGKLSEPAKELEVRSNTLDRKHKSSLSCDLTSELLKDDEKSNNFMRSYKNRSLRTTSLNSSVRHENTHHLGGNVKVIQIKESSDSIIPSQHTDEHGVTHIEIDSEPSSLASNSTVTSDYSSIISLSTPDAGDLITAIGGLPRNLSTRSNIYNSKNHNQSTPTVVVPTGREILVAGGDKDKKARQRQPPLILRAEPIENSTFIEPPKIVDEIPKSNGRSRKDRFDETKPSSKVKLIPFIESVNVKPEKDFKKHEISLWRDSRNVEHIERIRESRERPRRPHNKGPAPPPPPRRHPSNPSLMLIPTKNGQEPTKSLYPKESHIIRGNKIVRTEYPTFVGWTVGADGRYAFYGNPQWMSHEYHARGRDQINPEIRRRSRSKSPARRPTGYKYIDAMTTFNFTEKLKDFSEAVFQTKKNLVNSINSSNPGSKTHQRTLSTASSPEEKGGLKSLIKKNKKETHDRRVTFSAYATVQVMA